MFITAIESKPGDYPPRLGSTYLLFQKIFNTKSSDLSVTLNSRALSGFEENSGSLTDRKPYIAKPTNKGV